jgi:hypothetical protein
MRVRECHPFSYAECSSLMSLPFQIASLQEDKKAMERLTKSKESALLEAERILRSALERALMVEEVQNQNYELKRQIEICQVTFCKRFG